ncbi:bifunctional apoptosis regulator-like [Bufo gargarizans]|uniref:bifunctional apoptosis regulator-like n=1 Tax=Bufo gargarizans TaxID=30331 RepID=UPI001CF205F5|nr:bifunctional apoptosis regulator-like [Bufo gargarizans]
MEEDVKLDIDDWEGSSGVRIDRNISASEFSCSCCYDILVNPTTLNCGHSFCRHCLAQWWLSSKKTECPLCCNKCEEFPKVNILLRNVIEKLFPDTIKEKYEDLKQKVDITKALQAFNMHGILQSRLSSWGRQANDQRGRGDFSGLLAVLKGVTVVLLVCYRITQAREHDLLVHKPVSEWTPEEVVIWLEQLGPWTSHYKDRFLSGRVNGRLLLVLAEDEFSKEPYSIESTSHRKVIIMELEKVKTLGEKPPQNLWEYRAVNPGKCLSLFYALDSLPRLSILYMYLFDYTETFLPFIHSACPLQEGDEEDNITKFIDLQDPTWTQWCEFLVKYLILPYQLFVEFAWDWLEVHYWTSRFIIVQAMILSILELIAFWKLWSTSQLWYLSILMLNIFWSIATQRLLPIFIFWNLIPQFVWKYLFYYDLYISPTLNFFAWMRMCLVLYNQAMRDRTAFFPRT